MFPKIRAFPHEKRGIPNHSDVKLLFILRKIKKLSFIKRNTQTRPTYFASDLVRLHQHF